MKVIKKAYWAILFAFLYVPLMVMFVLSFNESKSRTVFTGFTFKWYVELFNNEAILKSLAVTLFVAVFSAVVATVLGTLAAVGISGMNKFNRNLIINISYMPVVNPEIITGVSLLLLFNIFKEAIGLQFGMVTLLIAHITFNLPYVILSVLPKIKQMDYRMYEAALDLGCHPRQAFFKVVIPEIMPGILSGFLMALTYSIDDFIISYFNSGHVETLPVAIYSMARRKVSPEIYALSTILFVIVLSILLVMNFRDNRKQKKKRLKEVD